ncbi:MAG: nucleotidyltransferase family protein [Actinobacteria bacterium]|nr:nucleotidyltransferase family protein [Actinomycetota bacterium]
MLTPIVSAIVLAAGSASRMGEPKLALPLGTRSVIQWVVDAALRSSVAETLVVVGHDEDVVRKQLEGLPLTIVSNRDYAAGMSSSLGAGIRAMRADSDAAIFLLGDQPFISVEMLDRLIRRFAETRARVVRAALNGHPCHPVLFSAVLLPEILDESGDVGGREVIKRHLTGQVLVPMENQWETLDVDTPSDYAAALSLSTVTMDPADT